MRTQVFFSRQAKYRELRNKNVAVMFRTTAVSMIVAELTGVIAVLIDGVVASRGLNIDAYSGISLVKPFASVILLIAGFLSTGCNLVSSRLIGAGKKKEANETFNLSFFLAVAFSAFLIVAGFCFPGTVMTVCGVNLAKYPELQQHIFGYLQGYLIGVPAVILVQVLGPVMVMDNGKRLFTVSYFALCAVDIIGDLLNVSVFHGGAFGMGAATSAAYIVQLVILLSHFARKSSYFQISPKALRFNSLRELVRNGTPALVKKLAGASRDIIINYVNIMVAVSTLAIAAKGIQNDLFQFLFCIPTGLGRTLITMTGIYYSANDVQGLKRLFSFAFRFGTKLTGIAAAVAFIAAPLISGMYTADPEVISLGAYSIRWTAVALLFDMPIVLMQHFFQGSDNLKRANRLSLYERFLVPSLLTLILGLLFGSKGVLAASGVSHIILFCGIYVSSCIYNHGIPKDWIQFMFLPKGFGGHQSDNMYAEIRTVEDAVYISGQTQEFCLDHNIDERKALFSSLCVEEMTTNVIQHAKRKGMETVCIDYHLFINEDTVCISLTDLSEQFDPTVFYEQHLDDEPDKGIGIRMVTKMAKEVNYYSTFKSNNLQITI